MEEPETRSKHRYFIINKPYNMVSQFVSSHRVNLLGNLAFDFPEGTHAIGRLDINSEGLLILTTNKRVTKLLFESDIKHQRTYVLQVENKVSEESVQQLRTGVTIRVKGGGDYVTKPCFAEIIDKPEWMFDGTYKQSAYRTYSWLIISLEEGKFRQVRKMVAAVNHPCKRLIRSSIENLALGNLQPGEVKEIDEYEFFNLLKIYNYKST